MDPRLDFVYAALSARVVFGAGRTRDLAEELEKLGGNRALFICTPRGQLRYAGLIAALGSRCVGVFADAQPHCPAPVAEAALATFMRLGADSILTVGGGSTIGLGKFIAAKTGRSFIAIPTTLSGSEMTALYGIKLDLEKRTWVDPAAKPRTVIYDPELINSLPLHEMATTGMNGLAHCVEALYPMQPNPIARMLALEGIAAFASGLAGLNSQDDRASRTLALYGGFIGGLLVSMVGIGLHHRICHVLGGHFGIPHGESNSTILAYVVAFNAPAMPEIAASIAKAMHRSEGAAAIFDLARKLGVQKSLRDLGLKRESLDAVAKEVVERPIHNPRPVTFDDVRQLLDAAWRGVSPDFAGISGTAPALQSNS